MTNASEKEGDEEKLSSLPVKLFQALVARANYFARDRSGAQFSVAELARDMSSPARRSRSGLVKLGEYLKTRGRSRYLCQCRGKPE